MSVSTQTMFSYLQIVFARVREAETEKRCGWGGVGGLQVVNGSTMDRWSTKQNVNKERRFFFFFFKGDLLIVPATECQLWLRCLVLGEK